MLLALLWVWAILVFVIIDLFRNVEEFDRIRPDSRIYRGMQLAAHEMVGEEYRERRTEEQIEARIERAKQARQ